MSIDRAGTDAAERCLYCPKMCRFACPVAHESARESLTPWGKMSLVTLALERSETPLPSGVKQMFRKARALFEGGSAWPLDADVAEIFYACTGCLRCRTYCEHENDVPHALLQARAVAAERGLAPAGAHAVVERFERHGHAQHGDLAQAIARLAEHSAVSPGSTSVLFAGCEAPLSNPNSVRATLRAASRLNAPLALAKEPLCCGRPLFEAGYRDAFKKQISRAWERLGDREVVALDAACVRALTQDARAVGVEPRGPVVHATTYLSRRLGPDVQALPLAGHVVWHDPCQLGRGLGEYDSPRRLLEASLAGGYVEAPTAREAANCCGAGGLVPETYPELAQAMAMSRADELRSTCVEKVATACPTCARALSGAGLEVVDVMEIVADWLCGPAEAPKEP